MLLFIFPIDFVLEMKINRLLLRSTQKKNYDRIYQLVNLYV